MIIIIAIRNDHQRDDAHFDALIKQGLDTNRKMTAMQRSSAEAPKIVVVPSGDKQRGYLSWQTGFVSVDSSGPMAGRIFVNVYCLNHSAIELHQVMCDAMMFIHNSPSGSLTKQIQEEYFQAFLKERSRHTLSRTTVGPKESKWTSAFGPEMTAELFDDLNNNRKVIVIVGQLSYQDDMGHHLRDLCEWLSPPINTITPAWHLCDVHY
jgi:hypothetical protein